MSANEAKRVALLARPGPARERLRSTLHEVGADIVLEDDPGAIDAQAVGDAAPEVVLVALEPAIEDSLARFDTLLDDPAIAVIFEEAELAARRDGWEARRWARHLAAKINGHDDVLPPGREEDASLALEPGLPPTPAQMHADAAIEPHVHEAVDRAWELPDDDFAYRPPAGTPSAVVDADEWLRNAAPKPEPSTERVESAESAVPAPVWDLALEPVTSEPAASSVSRQADSTSVDVPATSKWELSLEPLDHAVSAGSGPRTPGAVLVFAGIGGPDAIRKLLAELPPDFGRPLIIHLKLDGGRYDNLVRQMARVSTMPVMLAEAGHAAEAGHVYVLPGDVGIGVEQGAVDFRAQGALDAAMAQLPPRDSAVLLLSGSDGQWVDVAWPLAAQGAWVTGQAPEGCYDPAASHALAARGGQLATPNEMARELTRRWS
ncbi:chemotaxis protein CheB [Pseudoxanthomonas beigongshangi]